MEKVTIEIPATSANLGPGFDTLGLAIDLCNEVEIAPSAVTSMEIIGEGKDDPRIESNDVFLSIFYEHYLELNHGKKDHFDFTFTNRVPISRGAW